MCILFFENLRIFDTLDLTKLHNFSQILHVIWYVKDMFCQHIAELPFLFARVKRALRHYSFVLKILKE